MKKSWYTIKAQATDSVAEISVLTDIGMWGVSASEFIRDLKAIKAPAIHMTVNSPGGSVFDAVAMFHALRASGKQIKVTVLGIAASAASFLALAGDTIVMPEGTMMMLHKPLTGMRGNADDLREMAEVLDKVEASVNAIYLTRWKGSEDELKAVLSAETYLSAAECLERGLCDEIAPAAKIEARFDVSNLPEAVQAIFAKTEPEPAPQLAPSLIAQIKQAAESAGVGEFAAHFAADASLADLPTAVQAIADAREVKELCALADQADQAGPLIRQRAGLAQAREVIVANLAKRDADTPIKTMLASAAVDAPAAPEAFNPSAIWADLRAQQQPQRSK